MVQFTLFKTPVHCFEQVWVLVFGSFLLECSSRLPLVFLLFFGVGVSRGFPPSSSGFPDESEHFPRKMFFLCSSVQRMSHTACSADLSKVVLQSWFLVLQLSVFLHCCFFHHSASVWCLYSGQSCFSLWPQLAEFHLPAL